MGSTEMDNAGLKYTISYYPENPTTSRIINIEDKESKKCGERYGQSQNVIIGHGYYGIQQDTYPEKQCSQTQGYKI